MLILKLERDADKFLARVHPKHGKQIAQKIQLLRINPKPQDSKQLRGFPYLRTDSGEYRIIYDFTEDTLRILLIGKRNDDEVYKLLKRQ
ncbi:MAG: type II toxin-antitoxin system RelE/ParE family toxin [Pseudomonadota bacterium]